MKTCEIHDDCVVVYERDCPLCEAESRIETLDDEVAGLEERISGIMSKKADLEQEIQDRTDAAEEKKREMKDEDKQ